MATHYITHGSTGNYIEVTCTTAAGAAPDFSSGTFQIEVFRKGAPTSVVLDSAPTAVSPAATSGKLRYTFVSGDWSTIPNRTEEYHVIWWHTVGGVVTAYPGSSYDTLEVTADPQGVPADVSSVSYLSTAVAAATYETIATGATHVTLSTAQTITGQKTIQIDGNNDFLKFSATADKHVLAVYRYANPAGPEWDTGTIINSQGAYFSNAWMVISGTMPASPDQEGIYLPQHPSSDSFMLGIWSDIVGPALVIRANPTGSPGYLFQGMDGSGNYVFSVEDDGELQWGSGANHAAQDTTLYRTGAAALRSNATLSLDGGSGAAAMRFSADGAASFVINVSGGARVFTFQDYSCVTFNGGGNWYSNGIVEIKDGGRITTPSPGGTGINIGVATEKLGFFSATPIVKPTGVAVSAAGIHAALVSLGLIAA